MSLSPSIKSNQHSYHRSYSHGYSNSHHRRIPISSALLALLTVVLMGCGGPSEETVQAVKQAQASLQEGLEDLNAELFADAERKWSANHATIEQTLSSHGDFQIDGQSTKEHYDQLKQAYVTALDAQAEEWLSSYEATPDQLSIISTLNHAVGASKLPKLIAEKKARAEAERQAELARIEKEKQEERQRLIRDSLGTALLLRTRSRGRLPDGVTNDIPKFMQELEAAIKKQLPNVVIIRQDKDLPIGAEGMAAGVLDVEFQAESVSYKRQGSRYADTDLSAFILVPEKVQVVLQGRPGRLSDFNYRQGILASKAAPSDTDSFAIHSLASNQTDTLMAELRGKIGTLTEQLNDSTLQSAIAALPAVDYAAAPKVFIKQETKTGTTKGRMGQTRRPSLPMGHRSMEERLEEIIVRRMAPIQVVSAEEAEIFVRVDTTMYFANYGQDKGAYQSHSGSLPERSETRIKVMKNPKASADVSHPWLGTHYYSGTARLPAQVSDYGRAAVKAVEELTAGLEKELAVESALAAAYKPAPEGSDLPDQYLLQVKPLGSLAHSGVRREKWMKELPAELSKVFKTKMEPALITRAKNKDGRLAGLITIYLDGDVTSSYDVQTKKTSYTPKDMTMHIQVASAFSGTAHAWEGQHEIPVSINEQELWRLKSQQMSMGTRNRSGMQSTRTSPFAKDPVTSMIMSAVRKGLKNN